MDVVLRAAELTAHIGDLSKREKVKSNLTKFLTTLAQMPSDDEVEPEDEEADYRDAGDDGVPVTTRLEISDLRDNKLSGLRDLHKDIQRHQPTVIVEVNNDEPIDIDTPGKHGYTALHRAVIDGDLDRVTDLKTQGADQTIQDDRGFTALDRARLRADVSPDRARILALLV